MKKVWITIGITAGALLLALLVIRLLTPNKTQESGDDTSLYPYSYEFTSRGMVVHITGSFPTGYHWVASGDNDNVEISEIKQQAQKADFLISPRFPGMTLLTFSLQKEVGELADRIYELTCGVYYSSEKEISVYTSFHRELAGLLQGGEDQFTYQIASMDDGSLVIALQDTAQRLWRCELDTPAVDLSDMTDKSMQEAGSYRYVLRSLQVGSGKLYLCCTAENRALVLLLSTDLQGRVSATVSGMEPHLYGSGSDEDSEEYRRLLGGLVLPEDAMVNTKNITLIDVGQEEQSKLLLVGYVNFLLGGKLWKLYISDTATPKDFISGDEKTLAEDVARHTQTFSGVAAQVWDEVGMALWQDAKGYCYLLMGDNGAEQDLSGATKKIIEAMING